MQIKPVAVLGIAVLATLCALLLAVASAGAAIPNTGPGADPEAGFGHVEGAPNVLTDRLLDEPFNPDDPDPAEAAAAAALWSRGTPEGDLAAALDAMAAAGDASAADDARRRALDILEGNPLAKKAYSGIPLLNWNAPAKVKTVPAGGTVEVTQVRWGEHMVSDTWLLEFADPDLPFKIRYRVAELGTAFGGQLNPTPLLSDGGAPIGGQHSAIQPLAIEPNIDLGTHQANRFTDSLGLGELPEQTRSAIQEITVAMPPPRNVTAILDPNLREGHEAATTLLPATAERVAAAQDALGFSGASPSAAEKRAAIGRLADASPEKQVWLALDGLPGAAAAGFLDAARAAGEQSRALVAAMRSRTELPAGVAPDVDAQATVVLQNNEAYLSRRNMRLNPGETLRIQVVNRDGFAHRLTAFDLHNRDRIFGAWDWGRFDWNEAALAGGATTLAAGEARTFSITPAADSFAVWIGDLGTGDQANAVISVDRGIKQDALKFGATTAPVHAAPDAEGNVWVTLAGIDAIARIHPADRLADSVVEKFPLPGGKHVVDSPVPPLGPADVTVDGHGIVWATLADGNGVARIEPAQVHDGASDGIQIFRLDQCPADPASGCRPEVPPVPNVGPTRIPTRIKSMLDADGNTILWFAEAGASNVGVLRFTPDGRRLNEAHFPCGCFEIESIDLGPDGSIWFTQIIENQIGRLHPDPNRPFSPSAAHVDHYDIPSKVLVPSPPLFPNLMTSLPLSVAVDGRGLVWFSQSSLSGYARLDPAVAKPNTSLGISEFKLPNSDFRSAAAPNDVTVDRGNNLWWAGEYGDQIEQVTPDDQTGLRFRGSVRRGITEGPITDKDGNLWVVETGGNLITRITGVSEGPLLPAAALPAVFEADTSADTLTGVRLRDTASVGVEVVRDGDVVASALVGVNDGRFSIASSQWKAAVDPVRAEDTIRIQPHGRFARAQLSFRVASLSAEAGDNGSISGLATSGGQALGEDVDVSYGGGSGRSRIDGGSGRWRLEPSTPAERSTTGTVSWSWATVAGSFRTVTHFGPSAADGPQDAPHVDRPSPEIAPVPRGSVPARCAPGHWLYGSARAPRLLLLGMTRAQLQACLGRPSSTSRLRWRYGRGLVVSLRKGRVTGFSLRDARLRSERGAAGVGSPVRLLRSALPRLRRDRRTGVRRVIVAQGRKGSAEIRISVNRRGQIRRIDVTLLPRRQA